VICPVSIVVSGFGVREASWDRLRSCLDALGRQGNPLEVLLVETAGLPGEVPDDIRDILPDFKVVCCPSSDPWARKTAGVRAAASPIVAFVDADCMPQPGWVQTIRETFQYFPEVAVVHGCEEQGWFARLFPSNQPGPTRSTASNNVAFRREAYLDCPFPEGSGARAVAIQSASMRRARYVLWAEPGMRIITDRRGLKQVQTLSGTRPLPSQSVRL
jgi:hypothetical protein